MHLRNEYILKADLVRNIRQIASTLVPFILNYLWSFWYFDFIDFLLSWMSFFWLCDKLQWEEDAFNGTSFWQLIEILVNNVLLFCLIATAQTCYFNFYFLYSMKNLQSISSPESWRICLIHHWKCCLSLAKKGSLTLILVNVTSVKICKTYDKFKVLWLILNITV